MIDTVLFALVGLFFALFFFRPWGEKSKKIVLFDIPDSEYLYNTTKKYVVKGLDAEGKPISEMSEQTKKYFGEV